MNRSSLFLCGITVCAPLFSTSALAQPGQQRPRVVLQTLDQNGNGLLEPDEIQAASASILKLDANHDGQITPDEYQPQEHDRQAQSELQQRLMSMDRNGDGVLTTDEVPERMQQLFQRADANHDGKLTKDEIGALAASQAGPGARPAGRGNAEGMARMDPILNAIDIDHDGILSAAEIASAPGALKTLDKNGDGTLQPEELRPRQQTPAERAAHVMNEWDTNKDGALTKEECPDRMQQSFANADANHDGKLSLEELTAYFETQPQGQGRGAGGAREHDGHTEQPN